MEIYEGKEPYLFISYAHKNSKEVAPIIELLVDRGFRVWYDSGLEVGTEWPALISSHLKDCSVMLAFISDDYVLSKNCRNEVNLAMNKNKTVLAVYLKENVELTGGMDLQLASVHCVFRSRHSSDGALVDELVRSKMLSACKGVSKVEKVVSKPKKVEDKKPIEKVEKVEKEVKVVESVKQEEVKVENPPKIIKTSEDVFNFFTDTDGKNAVSIKKGVKCSLEICIPSKTSNGDVITKIANDGFKNAKFSKVYISEGITEIGENAFINSKNLTEIILPNTLESIGDNAFSGCVALKNVKYPASVKTIGSFAFKDCQTLRWVKFLGEVESVGTNIFYGCKNLYKVDWRFGLKKYSTSFSGCTNVTEVVAPYYNCFDIASVSKRLKKFVLTYKNGKEAHIYDNLNSGSPVTITGKFKVGGCGFAVPTTNTLIFSEGVESIQETSLKVENVVLPKSFNDAKSFYGVLGAEKIFLLDTKDEWDKKFNNALPVKKDVFKKPITKKYIYFKNEWTYIDGIPVPRENLVEFTETRAEIKAKKLPTDTKTTEFNAELYPYLNYEYDEFSNVVWVSGNENTPKNVIIPACTINGCETILISPFAFANNLEIESVTVSGAVTSIGNSAFLNCANLKRVDIEEGVQYIEGSAFKGCNLVTELEFPYSLKSLVSSVSEMENLNVLTIKGGDFFPNVISENCNALIKLNLPNVINRFNCYNSTTTSSATLIVENGSLVSNCKNVIYLSFGKNGDFYPSQTEYKFDIKNSTLTVKGVLNNLIKAVKSVSGVTNIIFDKNVTTMKTEPNYLINLSGIESVTATIDVALSCMQYIQETNKVKVLNCYDSEEMVSKQTLSQLKIKYQEVLFNVK